MNRIKNFQMILLLLISVSVFIPNNSFGQRGENIGFTPDDRVIYLDPEFGKDGNTGTEESPLNSLYEAARRINQANGKGAVTIILSEGIYGLDKRVTFHPVNWHFSKDERLTIRAALLPDDAKWNPAKMPVIVSTIPLNFH